MNILALCPHTDDELSCTGTLSRHIEKGDNVQVMAFSVGNSETGANESEFKKSMKRLGVEMFFLLDLKTRYFYERRQSILQLLCSQKHEDIIYCPATWDCHQDHQVVTQEAIRAFRNSSIYGYEVFNNGIENQLVNLYVVLDKKHIELKFKMAQCYVSQKGKQYMTYDYFSSLAQLRGLQINSEYAEAFQVIRSVVR